MESFVFCDETNVDNQNGNQFLEAIPQSFITKYATLDETLQHIKTFYMFMEDYCYNIVNFASKGHKLYIITKSQNSDGMLSVYNVWLLFRQRIIRKCKNKIKLIHQNKKTLKKVIIGLKSLLCDIYYRKEEFIVNNKEILEKIKKLSNSEKREIQYDELIKIIDKLTPDEIIELSNIIGYPVFTRMCMGVLQHKFVLLQDGAAAIIVNGNGQILLQSRADRNKWGLPGGCQELGEKFQETIIREIKEETNLDVSEEDLELIDIVSGRTRRNDYPNGDVVINNTVLYCIKKYSGELKCDSESKEMKFFDLNDLPKNQNDSDLIDVYKKSLRNIR